MTKYRLNYITTIGCKILASQLITFNCFYQTTTATLIDTVVIFWGIVLLQAFAHTLEVFPVAVFWPSVVKPQQTETLGVFGIASTAAVEQVQAQELAVVLGFLIEYNRGSQHTVDWCVFKLVEAGVYLLGAKQIQNHHFIPHGIVLDSRLKNSQILGSEKQIPK